MDLEKRNLYQHCEERAPVQRRTHVHRTIARLALALLIAAGLRHWINSTMGSGCTKRIDAATLAPAHAGHCLSIPPIGVVEFRERQKKLAGVLNGLGAAAYITEPGANAFYFTNVSRSQWGASERPFLLIVTPQPGSNGTAADLTVLTPKFEETRARLLTIPAPESGLHFVAWKEEVDPYATTLDAIIAASGLSEGTIFVDEAARFFIASRLATSTSRFRVEIAPPEIRALRESKSTAEIMLMTCANEATLLAIRYTRELMHIGIKASETFKIMQRAMSEAGLVSGFALVLFGEDAARPHGGGVDRTLAKDELVLIDAGGSLHGYESDITRTFALPESEIPSRNLELWFIVRDAQDAAAAAARADAVAGDVDKAARDVITKAGFGEYYTHRTGHGIGIEGHEDPYLRGNNNVRLVAGMAFSDEPGIYIDGKVGVRLEDIFVIDLGGARFLTDAVGGRAMDPWHP
ncbi:Creatinase/aminopeptidase [Auriculariales sp. MPI-PUGE-AT-0066]|nr:Creatinase/aminopeptidase [Auriculariales sp. MPI-PUGE-AT-0066]